MLWHLIDTLRLTMDNPNSNRGCIEIFTIESRAISGPGFPYAQDEASPYHLCNNPAEKMALFDNDFVDWMRENRDHIITHCAELIRQSDPIVEMSQWQPHSKKFYPRALFGIYLSMRFEQACVIAKGLGIKINRFNGYEAVDGVTREDRFELTIRCLKDDSRQHLSRLDKVLLASGHWHPNQHPTTHILSSPYPASDIHKTILAYQKKRARGTLICYVHGMGPSAVDAILSVCEYGRFSYDATGLATKFEPNWEGFLTSEVKIISGSRSGYFPSVRWPTVDHDFQFLVEDQLDAIKKKNKGKLPLDELIWLIDAELRGASNNAIGFGEVCTPTVSSAYKKLLTDMRGFYTERLIHTVILRARRLKFYQCLNAEDKRKYDNELDPHFIKTAVPIPLPNARKLAALFEANVLSSIRLGHHSELNPPFEINTPNATIQPHIVICAHHKHYDVKCHPSLLIRNLIDHQEVLEYNQNGYQPGGICADASSVFRVTNRIKGYCDLSTHLYAFGPVSQYWQNQNNYAAAFVNAAIVVAKDWAIYTKVDDQETGLPSEYGECPSNLFARR